jgi:hypothetical protein
MIKQIILIILSVLIINNESLSKDNIIIIDEDYKVIEAALNQFNNKDSLPIFVIKNKFNYKVSYWNLFWMCKHWNKNFKANLNYKTRIEFKKKYFKANNFETNKFKIIKVITVNDSILLRKLKPKESFWDLFYGAYKGASGLYQYSGIAYSKDKNYSIVYIGVQRHYLSGHGCLVLLKKATNGWIIIDKNPFWAS